MSSFVRICPPSPSHGNFRFTLCCGLHPEKMQTFPVERTVRRMSDSGSFAENPNGWDASSGFGRMVLPPLKEFSDRLEQGIDLYRFFQKFIHREVIPVFFGLKISSSFFGICPSA